MADRGDLWNKVDEIASKQQNLLPLIFGNWECFNRFESKELLISQLKGSFDIARWSGIVQEIGEDLYYSSKPMPRMSEEELTWFITKETLTEIPERSEKELGGWFNAIREAGLSKLVGESLKNKILLDQITIAEREAELKAVFQGSKILKGELEKRTKLIEMWKAHTEKVEALAAKLNEDALKRLQMPKVENRAPILKKRRELKAGV